MNVLLIGDDCLDRYVFGTISRMSPEAPVPILVPSKEEHKPGMAANVKRNLENLGITVAYLHGNTSIKTRFIDARSGHHLLRMDEDRPSDPVELPELTGFDAVVFSDYNKGSVSYELVREARSRFNGPIFVDTKKPALDQFEGCFVKINEPEFKASTGTCSDLIVTQGPAPVLYKDQRFDVPHVDVFDVCGAGDSFLSGLVYKYLDTQDIEQAIRFGIAASGVTIQHLGVYAPTLKEIEKC